MKILIADDRREIGDLIGRFLIKQGHEVDVTTDGKIATELIDNNHYDVAFLDHNMPEVTGLELVKYIRAKGMKTKTVILTGYPSMKEFLAKSVGADAYLNKPARLEEVARVLKELFPNDTGEPHA